MTTKDLEATLKEKISPLLGETMERSWGITIPQLESDITDRLRNPQLQLYIPTTATFREAKQLFRSEFIRNELRLHRGNISQLAKNLDVDRRSIHRAIKELEIDMEKVRRLSEKEYREQLVDQTIRSALDQYRQLIQPEQLEKLYEQVPRLSRNIAKVLPHHDLKLKDAEEEFERQFLSQALRDNDNHVAKTAGKIDLRAETLHRKIRKLRLK